ncbi:SDR family mycofactocin-dependent oxidoreductase [Tamaricihabitans halophyticus]|uniref:SDR family mycofactocin-dependent oxidoreductase n=1 Tax=Tamaricihabitans halophyticus TaxID=1262583 RepID=A0A4R2QXP3_9PSEU|nr:mycofactocin-coupled SDR family oxidoreductase [Tamaricihabitans halophyticus]TCP54124.1 SDR family mycofactocin-dependent oxidoreductase [Tamaricihabitans halophyticus]
MTEQTGNVALVTGAARGIGRATVARLASAGWRVVALDRCADDPNVSYPLASRAELTALAEAWPGVVLDVAADVRDTEALRDAVALAEREFGGVTAAIAAASVIAGGTPVWETSDGDWDALLDIGVRGVANLARATVPGMLDAGYGRFIALASAAAHRGLWHLGAYSAAKHAVVGLIKGLAADLRGSGVCAVAVSPGSTDTPMLAATARLYDLPSVTEFAQHQLIERILDPEEIAAVLHWLCGAESAALTGSVVHADGGFTG